MMNNEDIKNAEDLLSCPGDTLKEWLEEKGMTAIEFSRKIRESFIFTIGLLEGREPITESIAWKVEEVTCIPSMFWINLERRYRIKKSWIERAKKKIL